MPSLRERAIAEYHELLAADETLTPATFEKLRSAMRKKRLLYGDRPNQRGIATTLPGTFTIRSPRVSAELIALRD